jgi:hypothetical protein
VSILANPAIRDVLDLTPPDGNGPRPKPYEVNFYGGVARKR